MGVPLWKPPFTAAQKDHKVVIALIHGHSLHLGSPVCLMLGVPLESSLVMVDPIAKRTRGLFSFCFPRIGAADLIKSPQVLRRSVILQAGDDLVALRSQQTLRRKHSNEFSKRTSQTSCYGCFGGSCLGVAFKNHEHISLCFIHFYRGPPGRVNNRCWPNGSYDREKPWLESVCVCENYG